MRACYLGRSIIDGHIYLDESIDMDGWKQRATVCLWADDSTVATNDHVHDPAGI